MSKLALLWWPGDGEARLKPHFGVWRHNSPDDDGRVIPWRKEGSRGHYGLAQLELEGLSEGNPPLASC